MKKLLIISMLLLVCIFSAGCVNITVSDPESVIPTTPTQVNPSQTNPPQTFELIIGEWEGYYPGTATEYKLECLYDGYAMLETEKDAYPHDIEYTYVGAWEGKYPSYQVKLNSGNYQMTLANNGRTGELTTPDGLKITMIYDS